MKIILSRKGFDSKFGGYPSPILPNGTLISIPIPNPNDNYLSGIFVDNKPYEPPTYGTLNLPNSVKASFQQNDVSISTYRDLLTQLTDGFPLKRKKEYTGNLQTLYGIRLTKLNDLKVKEWLHKKSNISNINMDRLILDFLNDKMLDEQYIEIPDEIKESFQKFYKSADKKVLNLQNQLEMKRFERKTSLENYIYNKYPDILQRQGFCIKILTTQIQAELEILDIIYNLYEYENQEFVGYFKYYCEKNGCKFDDKAYQEVYNNLRKCFLSKWIFELKLNKVIEGIEDLEDCNLNNEALESYIFNIYEGKKLHLSRKEEYIEHRRKNESVRKIKKEKSGYINLINDLCNIIQNFLFFGPRTIKEEINTIELEIKIGFKPKVILDKSVWDLQSYFNYIKEKNLAKSFSYALQEKMILYMELSNQVTIPPLSLITNLELFLSSKNSLNEFILGITERAEKGAYNLNDLIKIGLYLFSINASMRDYANSLYERINRQNLQDLFFNLPEEYEKTLQFIKNYLEKNNIDLEEIFLQFLRVLWD